VRRKPPDGIDRWGFPIPGYVPSPPAVPVKGPQSLAHIRILEGLRQLGARRERRDYTHEEIAAACGVSDRYIGAIERRALRKMRKILEHHLIAAELI
jgi:DNA-binding XRE family transcriptional regulator